MKTAKLPFNSTESVVQIKQFEQEHFNGIVDIKNKSQTGNKLPYEQELCLIYLL